MKAKVLQREVLFTLFSALKTMQNSSSGDKHLQRMDKSTSILVDQSYDNLFFLQSVLTVSRFRTSLSLTLPPPPAPVQIVDFVFCFCSKRERVVLRKCHQIDHCHSFFFFCSQKKMISKNSVCWRRLFQATLGSLKSELLVHCPANRSRSR